MASLNLISAHRFRDMRVTQRTYRTIPINTNLMQTDEAKPLKSPQKETLKMKKIRRAVIVNVSDC